MKSQFASGSFALLFLLVFWGTQEASAQLLLGDDMVLTDATPTIIFEDTDTAGSNWGIRGWQENFRIEEDIGKNVFLTFNAVSYSTALGYGATAAHQAIGLGFGASATGILSSAVGDAANSTGNYSVAVGTFPTSAGSNSSALGYFASSAGEHSTALGSLASSPGLRSTAVGTQAYASLPNSVVLGSIAGVNNASVYASIGIGTPAPAEAVDVERSAAAARLQLTSFTTTANEAPQFIQRRARGTRLTPTAVQNNDNLGLFSFRGYNGATMGGSRATITAQAAGNFTGASTPTRLIFATTPVGQTVPQQVLVITPDGKVQIKGVNLNVPDYVFEDDYELMPLDELRSFIDTNGHLPGIARADEVKAEGLDLAGSQMALLQKVEELTLYTLQQQERITELEAWKQRVEHLEAREERIARLEAVLNRALAALD